MMWLTERMFNDNQSWCQVLFCTDGIFDKDRLCLLAWFSSSSQVLSQDSELVLLPGGKTFNSAQENTAFST